MLDAIAVDALRGVDGGEEEGEGCLLGSPECVAERASVGAGERDGVNQRSRTVYEGQRS